MVHGWHLSLPLRLYMRVMPLEVYTDLVHGKPFRRLLEELEEDSEEYDMFMGGCRTHWVGIVNTRSQFSHNTACPAPGTDVAETRAEYTKYIYLHIKTVHKLCILSRTHREWAQPIIRQCKIYIVQEQSHFADGHVCLSREFFIPGSYREKLGTLGWYPHTYRYTHTNVEEQIQSTTPALPTRHTSQSSGSSSEEDFSDEEQ